MAKQADPCMFCGEVPCVCNGPVAKKSAPRKRKPKAVADDTAQPSAPRKPKERKPLREPKARGTKEIKRERRPGAPAPEADRHGLPANNRHARVAGPIPDEELEPVIRIFDAVGLLGAEAKSKYRRLLHRPLPTGTLILREYTEGGETNED